MDINLKVIDLRKEFHNIKNLIDEGIQVPLLVTGNSMSPFLKHLRDTIYISKIDGQLRKGDIVFYVRTNGQFVMHRIHHIDTYGYYYMIGDAQREIEGPLDGSCIFGIIKKAVRKNSIIDENDFIWWFFQKVWIRIVPLRGLGKKVYAVLRKLK